MASRQKQLIQLAEEGNEEAKADLFKEYPGAYRKLYGEFIEEEDPTIKIKEFGEGGSVQGVKKGKRFIARGCGAVMPDRRKKTLYT